MKHPHHDLIVTWAADTSRVVQVFNRARADWEDTRIDIWHPSARYRFKPEPKPKPDRVEDLNLTHLTTAVCFGDQAHPNLRLTFDGETGKLKSAEVRL